MTTYHNKLVGDKIVDRIRAKGEIAEAFTLTPTKRVAALRVKLIEETKELMQARERREILKETADVAEPMYALAAAYGVKLTLRLKHDDPPLQPDLRISLHSVAQALLKAKNFSSMLPVFAEQFSRVLDQLRICEPELQRLQHKRLEERGGFEKGDFLVSTDP